MLRTWSYLAALLSERSLALPGLPAERTTGGSKDSGPSSAEATEVGAGEDGGHPPFLHMGETAVAHGAAQMVRLCRYGALLLGFLPGTE